FRSVEREPKDAWDVWDRAGQNRRLRTPGPARTPIGGEGCSHCGSRFRGWRRQQPVGRALEGRREYHADGRPYRSTHGGAHHGPETERTVGLHISVDRRRVWTDAGVARRDGTRSPSLRLHLPDG